jgi:hypothetical protein
MKNIFILSTDKPSRLCIREFDNKLCLHTDDVTYYGITQHIYITNNEVTKLKDWFISSTLVLKATDILDSNDDGELEIHSNGYCNTLSLVKKIILTTDQDLIADGVQSIDDEFLEWFIKNQSCEEIKVFKDERLEEEQDFHFYEIILPKEETLSFEEFRKIASKELLEKFDTDCLEYSEDGDFDNYFYANCKYWKSKLKEEPKQDAIEYSLNAFKVPKEYFGKEEIKIQCKDCSTSLEDCTCIEDTIDMKKETTLEERKWLSIFKEYTKDGESNLFMFFNWLEINYNPPTKK